MNEPKRKQDDDTPRETPEEVSPGEMESKGSASGGESTRELSLKAQLEAAVVERDANRDHWLRSQAELENFRKRVQKEADESYQYRALPLSRDLLPVFDNLQRAIQAAEKSQKIEELIQGLRMVAKQFDDALAKHGVTPIDAIGKPFDPNLHQALQQVPSNDHPPMTVLDEVERGYVLNERVVRPSSVIVSQAVAEAHEETESEKSA